MNVMLSTDLHHTSEVRDAVDQAVAASERCIALLLASAGVFEKRKLFTVACALNTAANEIGVSLAPPVGRQ
jgi:hypothetical protein